MLRRTFLQLVPAILLTISCHLCLAQNTVVPAADIHHADRFAEKSGIVQNGEIDLVFLGDSITHGWDTTGKSVQEKHFGDLKLVNLGLGWNCTEHVLWELENIPADKIAPRAVMIMIGTNNIGNKQNTAEEVIAGNAAILKKVQALWPDAKILLLGVFPRGEQPTNPFRAIISDTNSGLAKLADNAHVFFLDLGPKFLDENGVLHAETAPDRLHLTPAGYEIWANSVEATLRGWIAP